MFRAGNAAGSGYQDCRIPAGVRARKREGDLEVPAPLPNNPRQRLAEWGRKERAGEERAAREFPRDPRANVSGTWWSIPHGLVHTVGQVAAALSLVEDSLGSA
ncbi:hypothetical protein NicSoilB8_23770 [Arthrobacter sp. NicSoilB8]|nr:hypothetical protein NicSoilB8_23770 [Arthrobacter sp. NicSoilB8]